MNLSNKNSKNYTILKFLFSAWFFSLIFPILLISDYWALLEFRSNDRFAVIKFFFVALLMLYVLLFLSSDKKYFFGDLKKYFFFLLFIAICIISTIWSINPYVTFVNSILLLMFFLSFLKIKNIVGYNVLFPLVPIIILLTIIASIIINGFEGRFIGGNQPNIIGQFFVK